MNDLNNLVMTKETKMNDLNNLVMTAENLCNNIDKIIDQEEKLACKISARLEEMSYMFNKQTEELKAIRNFICGIDDE